MMPTFSSHSQKRLETCDHRLQEVFEELIKHFDCTILQGHRTKEEQEHYFNEGKSKVHYPNSKHNSIPSMAVDVVPWPIDWNNKENFAYMAGLVKGIALSKGIDIRWGGDFNMNNNVGDDSFLDMPHFEIRT